jgi:uncharacterized cupin superfamily protein
MHSVDLATIPVAGTEFGDWAALNGPLGIEAFGVNVVEPGLGSASELEHDETDSSQQELYVVLSGRVRFVIGGEVLEAGAGMAIGVGDPAVTRAYQALEAGTRVLCIGAPPAHAPDWGGWIGGSGA